MYKYRAYGLVLESEVGFPELPVDSGERDITVRLCTARELSLLSHSKDNRVTGKLPNVADVLVKDGREIWLAPYCNTKEESLRLNILGGCMAIIMQQRGHLVLHASCIDIGGRAIAFLGQSGAGKSTLAAAFSRAGYPLLTDDVLPVKLSSTNNVQPLATPSFSRIKLWPETLDAIPFRESDPVSTHQGSQKFSCWIGGRKKVSPIPLERIYVLGKGNAHAITPLDNQVAFSALIEHRRSGKGTVPLEIKSKLLYQVTQLIEQVTVKHFIRRPSLAALPELVSLVEADLAT